MSKRVWRMTLPNLDSNDTGVDNAFADTAPILPLSAHAPIGLFDSGVGGLSVYQHLAKVLPHERYMYYADTLHVPYGNRDSSEIEALTLRAIDWLYQHGCKLVVMACNSASAYALDTARARYPNLPIVGLVPALKPAVLASKTKRMAVLATKATLNGSLLNTVINEVAMPHGSQVVKYFDPNLVPWVEAGMPEDDPTAVRLRNQLSIFAKEDIDHLVLGCTHYPFFSTFLQEEIAAQRLNIRVLDSGQAIAARVQHLLSERGLLADETGSSVRQWPLQFYATKCDTGLLQVVRRLLGHDVLVQLISPLEA